VGRRPLHERPFLCRYYELTGNRRYVDDAARQFLGFRKLLYLPEEEADVACL